MKALELQLVEIAGSSRRSPYFSRALVIVSSDEKLAQLEHEFLCDRINSLENDAVRVIREV